jgi:Fusaric acid resistance protein-like
MLAAAGLHTRNPLNRLALSSRQATQVAVATCLFLGFYLNRVSYAMMIFFITIVVGQMYSVLHEFQPGLLTLRLEETAIGGAIGVAVALLVAVAAEDLARGCEDLADLSGRLAAGDAPRVVLADLPSRTRPDGQPAITLDTALKRLGLEQRDGSITLPERYLGWLAAIPYLPADLPAPQGT